jgi:hypothetical protein
MGGRWVKVLGKILRVVDALNVLVDKMVLFIGLLIES